MIPHQSVLGRFMSSLCGLLLLLSLTQSHPSECSYEDDKYGVKFNYYGLKLSSGEQLNYYTVHDAVPNDPRDPFYTYTYQFNLCAPVLDFPTPTNKTDGLNICLNPSWSSSNTYYTYCESKYINTSITPNKCTQVNKETINGKAYAYQLRSDNRVCYPLSNNEEASKAYSISLYDPIDPTQGLTIQYHNGAWSDICGANRQLRIHLKCDYYASSIPKQMDVTESEGSCQYELTIKSIHACPIDCPVYANSLCASHGLCGYDFSTNRSHCFCFWGYTGSACEQAIPDTEQWKPTVPAPDTNPSDYIQTFSRGIEMTDPFTGEIKQVIVNTTYDLSAAYNPNSIYQINNTAYADVGSQNDYRFYFNIGGTINSEQLPKACHKVAMPCKSNDYSKCMKEYITNISISDPAEIGFAFRYTNNTYKDTDDECIMLGTQMVEPWTMYDPDDNAAHGVRIAYKDGSFMPYMSSPSRITNCEFIINLICPKQRIEYFEPADGLIIDYSEVIYLGSCSYEATFETAFACPYNCITENKNLNSFSVCSGNGMCIADPSAGFTRCVCDEMYNNSDCSKQHTDAPIPTIIHDQTKRKLHLLIVVMTVLFILVFVAIIVVVYCIRRRKNNMNHVMSKEQVNTQESAEINEGISTKTRKETYCELQDAETDDYC